MRLYKKFEIKLIRTFSFFSTGVHCLCGLILILTGAWHAVSQNDTPAIDKFYSSGNPYFGWIIITTGGLLVMWAVMGWVTLVKRSRELEIICVILNIGMIVLQVTLFFILCGSPESEFLKKKNTILVLVFAVSILSSVIHLFIFIIKCTTISNEDKLEKESIITNHFKPSPVLYKLAFSSEIYSQSMKSNTQDEDTNFRSH
eukprot:GFUD01003752.1.p1 GENE.GFUD01003752.1~~GFUD01003752.1.p1  ORF type:complete len:201 (+),score=21.23 GFUD01003752.1:38-640(+)